jgi:hypothetical protein
MKRWISTLALTLALSLSAASARADFNLINVDLGSPDARRAESLYGQAYGFQPVQVAPVMAAPAEEVPAIMQIAQAAGTLPISVWMLRQSGMNYGQIMRTFAVAPLVTMGQPVTDAYYVQRARQNFLVDILRVDRFSYRAFRCAGPTSLGSSFTRSIPRLDIGCPRAKPRSTDFGFPRARLRKWGFGTESGATIVGGAGTGRTGIGRIGMDPIGRARIGRMVVPRA